MKQPSYWEKETLLQPYDLIIIGAGIVGLSSALFYKRQHPDARVLVVEKGAIPEGASTRNAGFACVGSITEHMADLDKETVDNIKHRLRRRYKGLHLLRDTLGDEAIEYDNCGGYEIFTEQGKFEEAALYVDRFNSWMEELVNEVGVYQPAEFNGYPAIYNRLEGALHPGKMMQTLIHCVQSTGADILWNTKVHTIQKNGALALANGHGLKAKQVLVSTNGFTKRLLPDLPVNPARGFLMVSREWPNIPWKGIFNYDRGYVYFRNVGNRLLLGGGRNQAIEGETLDEFGTNEAIKTYLTDFARNILGMPHEIPFEYEWSGIMGFTATKTPILNKLDRSCLVAAGLSGMGIAIGMEVGREAARKLNGNL